MGEELKRLRLLKLIRQLKWFRPFSFAHPKIISYNKVKQGKE